MANVAPAVPDVTVNAWATVKVLAEARRGIFVDSHASASVPPAPAFGIALAAAVAVATSSVPPCLWLVACAEGAKAEGFPLMLAQVRSVSRAIVLFSHPSAILPLAPAIGTL